MGVAIDFDDGQSEVRLFLLIHTHILHNQVHEGSYQNTNTYRVSNAELMASR